MSVRRRLDMLERQVAQEPEDLSRRVVLRVVEPDGDGGLRATGETLEWSVPAATGRRPA